MIAVREAIVRAGNLLYDNPACLARLENLLSPWLEPTVSEVRNGLTRNLSLPKDKITYVIHVR